jgi:hypothetical protein
LDEIAHGVRMIAHFQEIPQLDDPSVFNLFRRLGCRCLSLMDLQHCARVPLSD